MIDQGLFQKKIVGKDGFIWWIGQIASDSWKINAIGSTAGDVPLDEQAGFGYRYQIRIMGYHTADEAALSDNDLPWASVMYPVTAGANAGSAGATPNLRKGNFVYGFFVDGEDAQQPVIMGVLGYNQYTPIVKDSSRIAPFVPFLGYSTVPPYSIKDGVQGGQGGRKSRYSSGITNLTQGGQDVTGNAAASAQLADGKKTKNLDKPFSCAQDKKFKEDTSGEQSVVRNLIQEVQNAKAGLKDFKKSLINPTWSQIDGRQVDIDQYIAIKMNRASKQVTAFIKEKIKAIQDWIVKRIESALQKVYEVIFPPLRSDMADATRTAMDILQCHFRKIINNLFKMVYQALTGIVDNYINVPLCAIENIVASILSKLMGLINGIVSQVMGIINGILGTIDQALDIVIDAFEFIDDILDFLKCEEKPECPPVEKWSTWLSSDPESTQIDALNLLERVKEFSSNVSEVVDPDNFDFDVEFDFGDILDNAFDNCDTNPILCGPPRAVFWGGSGNGASGNVIVSAAGDILGVDIVNSGSGYDDRPPFLTFKDDCGNGHNGHGTVVTGPVSPGDEGEWFSDPDGDEIGVIGVNINDSGFGYLPVADGSQGGDGRTWADYTQTTVHRIDGSWDEPWDPGEVIPAYTGDVIRIPIGCKTQFFATDGKTHEVFGGSNFTVPSDGVLTSPSGCADSSRAGAEDGGYPVALYICEVDIINPGFGYQPTDKVVITPDVGAEITPTFGPFGNLIKLEIINGGEGFGEFPTIEIESDTGFNAEIRARLCIDRITDELKLPDVQDKVVQVVDCVGKV